VVTWQQALGHLEQRPAERQQQALGEALLELALVVVEVLGARLELGEEVVDRRGPGQSQPGAHHGETGQRDEAGGDEGQRGRHSSTALTICTMMKVPMPISSTAMNSRAIPPPVSIGAK
jgi:hypothetical protein